MLVPLLRPVDEHGNGSTARAWHPRGQPRHTAGMETHSRSCPVPRDSENPAWEGARSNLREKSCSKRSAWWHRTYRLGAPLQGDLKPGSSTAPCRAAVPLPGYQRSQQRAEPRAELPNRSCKSTATRCRWQRLFCRHPACSARGHPPLRSHPKPSGTTSHTSTHTQRCGQENKAPSTALTNRGLAQTAGHTFRAATDGDTGLPTLRHPHVCFSPQTKCRLLLTLASVAT